MKKCPKCGTVLDDSKKKCYMCGAELQKSSAASFGDSFNAQIGATMSIGQDNVFQNSNNINASVKEVGSKNLTQNKTSSSSNLYQNQLNGLNSLQYDERTKFEKIFDSTDKKKSKNKKEETIKNTGSHDSTNGNVQNIQGVAPEFNNASPINNQNNIQQGINWGDNLKSQANDVWKFKDKVDKNNKGINISIIFNFICFLLCIGGIAFVYFKFIKEDKAPDIVSFGGLRYSINENFILKTDDSYNKYYTYGDNCAVRLRYGTANNPDSFIENYFEEVKDTYANRDGYNTMLQKLTINDNQWSELSVQGLKENAAAPGGYSFYSKYKHIAIVHKENFYDIVYANTEDDSTCSGMYDSLISSFFFE